LLLRNHLIGLLEKAEVETAPAARKRLLSIVVVGAGFSGVEVTGEIFDLLKESACFYAHINPGDIQVTLLEGRHRVVPECPESLSQFALKKMSGRGITIRLGAVAQAVSDPGVRLKDGTEIVAGTVVCTIGTKVNPLIAQLGLPMERNRLRTQP